MSKSKRGNINELYREIESDLLAQEDELEKLKAQIASNKKLSKLEAINLIERLEKYKGRVSNRIFKDLTKEIKTKTELEEEIIEPGPRATEKDVYNLQRIISTFFRSPFAKEFQSEEKIKFYLGGSLVSGFSQNKNSPYFGKPSDYKRVSDVDIAVFISPNLFETLFKDKKLVEKHLGHKRTTPFGEEEKFSSFYSGPFKNLIEDVSKLIIAGKKRNVNFTFFEHGLLDLLEIHKEHLTHISDITTI